MNPYDYYIAPEEYAAAAANGISRQTLNVRIRVHGWDKQRAMSEPPQARTPREWRKVAEANGIKADTFYARVNRMGWDEERAATTPLHPNPQELAAAARRKIPKKLYERAAANGIPRSTFVSRIYQSGWDRDRAATEPVWTKQQVDAYGLRRYKERYGDNPMRDLFPHRAQMQG